jgi:cytochrome c
MRSVVGTGVVVAALALVGCGGGGGSKAQRIVPGGDPGRGARLIEQYGCGSCHTIPGISGANGTVGPKLADFASARYIGGVIPNTPQNLIAWIENPKRFSPQTVMPNLAVTPDQARDIAAYLYGRT